MKKLIWFISCFVTAVLLAASVYANTYTVSPYESSVRNYDEVFSSIYSALSSKSPSADITKYYVKSRDLIHVYNDIIMSSPELFYADQSITYYYDRWDNVTKVMFSYTMSDSEITKASAQLEREVDYVVSLVDPLMNDTEKALFVHDYLISAFSYDSSAENYDTVSFFRDRRGVCQAYSLAYMAILRELGMEVVMVTSDSMNHAWNLVKIGGEWYHVDLTFDDPAPDRCGRVLHENFLLDDASIKTTSTPHYGWSSSVRCRSSKYQKQIWNNVTSKMIRVGGQWYYIDKDNKSLVVSDINGGSRTTIYKFRDKWMHTGSKRSFYVGVFSGLSEYFGSIFINTPYEIIIYNPHLGRSYLFHELTADEISKGLKIFGSDVYKNALEYYVADNPNSEDVPLRRIEIDNFDEMSYTEPFPFDDVLHLNPYYASIKFVYGHGLFRGVSSTKFAPEANLTRAMFVTVLGRLCEIDTSRYQTSDFADVDDGEWYTPYVAWAAETGIVNGIGNNLFDPTGELTHEQMYRIVAQYGEYLSVGSADVSAALMVYADRWEISDWAYDSVLYCKINSLISDQTGIFLYPQKKSTRAEAADIVSRFVILSGRI